MASSLSNCFVAAPSHSSLTPSLRPLQHLIHYKPSETNLSLIPLLLKLRNPKFTSVRTRATLDEDAQISTTPSLLIEEKKQLSKEVEESVRVLKNAAKTRKVPADEILQAFSVIEKAKLDPSRFLETLGGTKSPGNTWMLIFTAQKKLDGGKYFPITAIQRFDAAVSWNKRILAFIFEQIRIKVGPLNPFEFSLKGKDEREPSNKDPFFIWFYIDEEIAVARGRSGGTAFWVRCQRIGN
ncbi:hypothetical protein MIMGU_mgv1a012850mg [Erythranthe guttata]|uniref:Plastid lipid-associated protein/fibrillin conserved domain-containing protein n=1 Tax=Erythranthe guttata TaxID=4155 RepID=A0A022RMP7_ERYGU|nr:hypothetical protein MIMGU_mgv1a012850mg [Erythranthe guttata]